MAEKKESWFKRHKILTVVLAIVVIAAVSSALSAGGGDKQENGSGDSPEKAATTAKVGEAARDGKFEFTVKSIDCSQNTVGSEYLSKTAQGKYCQLAVTVKNIGNEAQTMFADNQKLLNSAGQEFSADSMASAYTAPQGGAWVNEINPGNSVDGIIVFDLPVDQTPSVAELHDSAYSGGVKVTL